MHKLWDLPTGPIDFHVGAGIDDGLCQVPDCNRPVATEENDELGWVSAETCEAHRSWEQDSMGRWYDPYGEEEQRDADS